MTDLTWKRSKWIYGKINLTERVVCQQPPLSCHLTPQEPSEKTINFWRSAHKPTSSSSRFREDNFLFLFKSIFTHFLPLPLLPPLTKKTWPFLRCSTFSYPFFSFACNKRKFDVLVPWFSFSWSTIKRMYECTNSNSVFFFQSCPQNWLWDSRVGTKPKSHNLSIGEETLFQRTSKPY